MENSAQVREVSDSTLRMWHRARVSQDTRGRIERDEWVMLAVLIVCAVWIVQKWRRQAVAGRVTAALEHRHCAIFEIQIRDSDV